VCCASGSIRGLVVNLRQTLLPQIWPRLEAQRSEPSCARIVTEPWLTREFYDAMLEIDRRPKGRRANEADTNRAKEC